MKKYCRYCAFCIAGDTYYCTEKQLVLKRINGAVNCDSFVQSELGDIDTGKQYSPRESKAPELPQVTFFELEDENK